ncbi:hypothetical protein M5585_25735 [Serratia ureilytica]
MAELENDPQLVVVRITAGAATDAQGLDKQLTLAGKPSPARSKNWSR